MDKEKNNKYAQKFRQYGHINREEYKKTWRKKVTKAMKKRTSNSR